MLFSYNYIISFHNLDSFLEAKEAFYSDGTAHTANSKDIDRLSNHMDIDSNEGRIKKRGWQDP